MPTDNIYSERVAARVAPLLKAKVEAEARRLGWRESDVIRAILTNALVLDRETERGDGAASEAK